MDMLSKNNPGELNYKTKLTPELQQEFCFIISRGNYYTTACNALGVSYQTFRRWMRAGEQATSEESIYRKFYLAVQLADAQGEVHAVEQWRGHFSKEFRVPATFLAARYPHKWADHTKVEGIFRDTMDRLVEALKERLEPDHYQMFYQATVEILEERDRSRSGLHDAAEPTTIDVEFSTSYSPAEIPASAEH